MAAPRLKQTISEIHVSPHFLLDKPTFGDKMRKFSISIRDSDLDILKRACQYGISSVSKLEVENGEAARIKFVLSKIIEQIDRKKA